ncbi:Sucrose-6-phosphate hydrolase [Corynebacterium kalinowskii]|uniref:beta-fructofuranosidase n=1 Tax=Corynebacterium kalinowskii TaxID=2675216 RepID=A0A6B8VRA1_9CORY|nr:GH32 C-terminal domain-containing protein [Corynebacterium kalinowskii]QGU02391.1 Sucrose-6-phosphate hydrolase [Corynebacterium kalinowskii]
MSYYTHRPELHITAERGILNAPAGVLRSGNQWHVFHQYQPELDAPARWAHQFADQLPFDWDICDDAIAPEGDEIKVRAGAVIGTRSGSTELYFTSINQEGTSIHVAEVEDIDASLEEVSDDASAVDKHVRRVGQVVGNRDGFVDFRSPCVVPRWDYDEVSGEPLKGWLMLAVSGDQDKPQLMVLDSYDRREWSLRGPLTFDGTTGLEAVERLVSPRIIRLSDEVDGQMYDVLLVTIEHEGIDISGYLIGQLTGSTFTVKTSFTRLDFGHDFTRPRNTNVSLADQTDLPDYSSANIFGLMNGIGRYDDPSQHLSLAEEGWANCLSLPRVTTLQDGLIYQTPTPGLPAAIRTSERACMLTALIDASAADAEVQVELIDDQGRTAAVVCHQGDLLTFDRSMNPNHEGDHIAEGPLIAADTDALTIIVDGSAVEVFADGGAMTMASRLYAQSRIVEFRTTAVGSAVIEQQSSTFPLDFPKFHGMEPALPGEDEL